MSSRASVLRISLGENLGRVSGLPAVASERLVGVGHLGGVFLLLHGVAAHLRGVDQLGSEAFAHGLLAAVAGVEDQPAHGQCHAALGANLDRNLIGGTTDAAALHLELG